MSRDTRVFKTEFRAVQGSKGRQFWAMPLAYEVVDDYGTIWTRGVFDESAKEKMPALMWGHAGWHDIDQMMGGGIDYRDTGGGPEVLYELLKEEDQPRTRILAGLMAERESGPPFVRDMSVGFDRWSWQGGFAGHGQTGELAEADRSMTDKRGRPAVERMLTAGWDESSLVVAGAVPGAKALEGARMVQVRSASGAELVVPRDTVVTLARQIHAGDITFAEAQTALALAAGGEPDPEPDVVDTEAVAQALAEAEAELDEFDAG